MKKIIFVFLPGLILAQQFCQILKPTGSDQGTDGSGLRPKISGDQIIVGENLTYICPGVKMGERDGKTSYIGSCIQDQGVALMEYEFNFPWPICVCPESVGCSGTSNIKAATSTRYSYEIEAGDNPGLNLSLSLPPGTKVWEVVITWDIFTHNDNIIVSTRTKGIRIERTDFQGQQHRISPFETTESLVGDSGRLFIDVGFGFRNGTIREDSQKWHYPCVERMECEMAQPVDTQDRYMNLLFLGIGVSGVIISCACICGTITWCLQYEQQNEDRPMTAFSNQKIRPDSGLTPVDIETTRY